MGPHPSRSASVNASVALAADMGCVGAAGNGGSEGSARLACLRKASAADLARSSQWDQLNFGLDDHLLHTIPEHSTLQHATPLLIGVNSLDTTCLADDATPQKPTSEAELMQRLGDYFGEDASAIVSLYPAAPSPLPSEYYSSLWLNMSRDAGAACPSLWLARRFAARAPEPPSAVPSAANPPSTGTAGAFEAEGMSEAGAPRVFLYSFEFNATAIDGTVNHGGEEDSVWQRPPPAGARPGAGEVSTAVGLYWASFVHRGVPEVPPIMPTKRWPRRWPPLASTSSAARGDERFLEFTRDGSAVAQDVAHSWANDICDAWEAYRARGALQRQRFIDFGYLC